MNCWPEILVWIQLGGVFLGAVAVLWGAHWVLLGRNNKLSKAQTFPRQMIMLFLTIGVVMAVIVALPVNGETRTQLVALVGIIVSALVAFSSTTVVANLMAGLLLRITKPFQIGDFIRTGEHFGRVSELGLFHAEIQSEYREFIALPNTFLIRNPVTAISGSGTIVSSSVSLGYDRHHTEIEPLLKQAAVECGLEDPFVHILELGNYAITYRVAGFLSDVKGLITARSNLCRAVLDQLHGSNVEIVSPTFMNQRRLDPAGKVIPARVRGESGTETRTAEDIVFDKAEQAARYEEQRQHMLAKIEAQEEALKKASKEESERIKAGIVSDRDSLKRIEDLQKVLEADNSTRVTLEPENDQQNADDR